MKIEDYVELQLGIVFHVIWLCLGSTFVKYRHHSVIPARLPQPFTARQDVPVISCLVLCSQDPACAAINHHNEQNACELVNTTGYFHKYDLNNADGWEVYSDSGVDTMYTRCSGNSDCLVPNSRCFTFCFCKPLFEYVESERTCSKICDGYGSTFTRHDDLMIEFLTVFEIAFPNAGMCKQHCLDFGDTCQTVDYRPGPSCQGKIVTIQEAMKTGSLSYSPGSLYTKNCEN